MNKLMKKLDSNTFAKKVEEMVRFRGLDYMDAIIQFCAEEGLDVEAAGALVRRCEPIRQKLEAEVTRSNLLKSKPGNDLSQFL